VGATIDRDTFDDEDYARFGRRLRDSVDALAAVLDRPGFGAGPATLGAELELFLVDRDGRPLPENQLVRAEAVDPRVVLEVRPLQPRVEP
jgi:hypothetical protein